MLARTVTEATGALTVAERGVRVCLLRKFHNPNLVSNSRNLRKNMTDEEKNLWYKFLRKLSVPVYRQRIIGNYIVDFCCPAAKIVIELDGSQHYNEENRVKDKKRDEFLSSMGFKVLRYTNIEVNQNFNNVCNDIFLHINGDK